MIFWVWLGLAFLAGVGVTLLVGFVTSLPRPPRPPRCPAVLRSGECCAHYADHTGPHRATIYLSPGYTQAYVWEDPHRGVHPVGFFFQR